MIPCRAAVLKYAPGWARANGISSVIQTAQTRVDTRSRCAWSVKRCVLLLHRAQPAIYSVVHTIYNLGRSTTGRTQSDWPVTRTDTFTVPASDAA